MGTVTENQRHWAAYDWSQGGDEWSEVWGGSESLWWGTLHPRVRHLLPVGTLLEIAPGYGRFTRFLRNHCERLIGVDLTERCVEACRQRFSGDPRLTFHVNDGRSLPMVEDGSIDLAFSFDSLVHVEIDVIEAYLRELGRTLRPGGTALLHHSNMAQIRADGVPCENRHWRAESVSAALLAEAARRASLVCIGQETVNWGGDELTDCISVLTTRGSRRERPLVRIDNPAFMAEATRLAELARVYRP